MIPINEFGEKARINKVPITTIVRDYAQDWLLVFLPKMAFKGGTCLRKIYIKNYRFSDDLDFTLLDDISFIDLKKKIRNSMETARNESGINFLDDIKSEEIENGFVFLIYFRLLRTTGDPLKIKIDVTKNDKENIVNDILNKTIIHDYSDKFDKKTLVYSLEEIFAEKTRSLFERVRPRDLYDVWYLIDYSKFDKSLFEKKCEFKNFTPSIDELQLRKSDFINSWENSLKHQLKNLPSADEVFNSVIKFLENKI
jgi:predicted nucleotidyltransferase component of viral defense system